jgi:hypothetical protein
MSSTVIGHTGLPVIQGSINMVFVPEVSLNADWPKKVTVTLFVWSDTPYGRITEPSSAYAAVETSKTRAIITPKRDTILFISTSSFLFFYISRAGAPQVNSR